MTRQADAALRSGTSVLLRTRHHPAVGELDPNGKWESCDDLYGAGAAFDDVYGAIVLRVQELLRTGNLVYAVPGNPLVAERTVELLLTELPGDTVSIIPALSYVDLAAVTLRRTLDDLQICDAHEFRISPGRDALIAQVHDRDTVSAIKLALLEFYPGEHPVTVLHALATGAEEVLTTTIAALDHRAYGYLDTLFIPSLPGEKDVRTLDGLRRIVERLNAPDGCPWDREQTHTSLRPHMLEESYEALDAIDDGDTRKLVEELGDVLLQVLMHAEVGVREGTFTLSDVTEHISRKLIRRHPHVFGAATAGSAEEVWQSWESLKKAERPEGSVLDGVPRTMPALSASQAIQGRARRIGFDWPDIDGPLEKLREEVEEFARAADADERTDEFGDVLFVIVNIAQRLGIDAEQALRGANEKFRRRFGEMERVAAEHGVEFKDMDLAGLDALWEEAKARLG